MRKISTEMKAALVQKVLTRGSATTESIAVANNVGLSSLEKWVKKFRSGELQSQGLAKDVGYIGAADRLNHLLKTAGLDEESVGRYCREHGLYSHQLSQWKAVMSKESNDNGKQQAAALKVLRHENAVLKKELRRKEKALAETAALLVLKKKADLIWGGHEDD